LQGDRAKSQDDIYNEIDLEDLRGPAVDTTIRLDVQDKEDATNGDAENPSHRGIIAGKTMEVSYTHLLHTLIHSSPLEVADLVGTYHYHTRSLDIGSIPLA
jgi:hypothetical protein